MTTGHHEVSAEILHRLALGQPDPDAIHALGSAQISRRLLLIRHLVEMWPGTPSLRDTAVAVLIEAQERNRTAVAAVLAEPVTGAWAAQAVRHLRDPRRSAAPLAIEAAYLSALATAAAARTGLDAKLTVHTRGGLVAIPSLGAAHVPLPDHSPVQATVVGGALRLAGSGVNVDVPDDPGTATQDWLPLRKLSAEVGGRRFIVALNDLDPFRDSYDIPPTNRLSEPEAVRWHALFEGAWRLLVARAPGQASELAAGLHTMVPLTASEAGPARSTTVGDAFGSFGLTMPGDPVELAITMVHELQHSKLSALLDLIPLHEPPGNETYFAPWRNDPRPVNGLFQGVYAFLAIGDLWRALLDDPSLRPQAERGLAWTREQVRTGLAALIQSGKLTSVGEHFAAGMQTRLDTLLAVPVPAEINAGAQEALRRSHEKWLRRNRRS